jgi:hypothetical protein
MVAVSCCFRQLSSQGSLSHFKFACCVLYVLMISDITCSNLSNTPTQLHVDNRADRTKTAENIVDYENLPFSFPWIENVRIALERYDTESEVRNNPVRSCRYHFKSLVRQALKVSRMTSPSPSDSFEGTFSLSECPPATPMDFLGVNPPTQQYTFTPFDSQSSPSAQVVVRRSRSPSPRRQCHVCKVGASAPIPLPPPPSRSGVSPHAHPDRQFPRRRGLYICITNMVVTISISFFL